MADPRMGQIDPERQIRAVLIEDHRLIGEMARLVLHDAGIIVVGIANRLDEVPALLEGEAADVALVDDALPDGRGTSAIRRIRQRWPGCRVVLLTRFADRDVTEETIAAGADGIMSRSDGVDELVRIVRRAAAGDVLLDPTVLAGLILRPASERVALSHGTLNDRERDALEILLEVGSIGAAAARLGITESTYRVHLHHAMRKLGVGSRLEAISAALRAGLIRAPRPGDGVALARAGRPDR